MTVIVISLLIIGAVAFFVWADHRGDVIHAKFTKDDVIPALECMLDDKCSHDEFDLFLGRRIDDPNLESIRQRCLSLCQKYPGGPGEDIAREGKEEIKKILKELRAA